MSLLSDTTDKRRRVARRPVLFFLVVRPPLELRLERGADMIAYPYEARSSAHLTSRDATQAATEAVHGVAVAHYANNRMQRHYSRRRNSLKGTIEQAKA